ncbi:cysteine desulfurase family protein [Megasphaera vaginalis (ex Bordigoni et al. 2020)]|uniref:cysteine desulfurase family protein n=1 Tax=Megasphaera vaginalis (ex Bordigoni et al. 2020) TaxID=2045301 RepID=UPI000C7CF8D8|nr:cysteine desulfurase family protein [Megasphaera vaginalis (ex Bordigoni et al. 2020)]
MERIYLDYAAATPLDGRVLQAMMPYLTKVYGNPSSLHVWGQEARAAVQTARRLTAAALGVNSGDVVFTGGGTEADNLAILGFLRANCRSGGHLITTAVEHHAVLRTFEYLAAHGYEVTFLPVEHDGRVSPQAVQQAVRDDTRLISVMYANNETGMIQPVDEIGAVAAERGIAFHVDAVQAFGYIPIEPIRSHIDLLTVCGHKLYGPKGIGALYIRRGLQLAADTYGGPQEHRLRAGTENVPAIVGFGEACRLLAAERTERYTAALTLKRYIYDRLQRQPERIRINGTLCNSLPNIIDISIRGTDHAVTLIRLDRQGIAVSAGSACESGALTGSHVLRAMAVGDDWIDGSIRISWGKETTAAELKKTVAAIEMIAAEAGGKS